MMAGLERELAAARGVAAALDGARARQESISAQRTAAIELAGLGPRLAEVGIPAVVAMQGSIRTDTAPRFMPAKAPCLFLSEFAD